MKALRAWLVASIVVCGSPGRADPPRRRPTARTHVTWRILANTGPDDAVFSSRFEVIARSADGVAQRVGPLRLPCYLSSADGVLTCVYGGAFDYLRIRRSGRECVVEGQRSTEHGMRPRRALGHFRCDAPVEESIEPQSHPAHP